MKKKIVKATKKCISLFLAGIMLLTMQGLPVMAETVGSGTDESANPANPVHHCTKEDDGSDYTDWSYVYFGSYPQTEVTGDDLTAAITGASYDSNGDAWVNGTKYRRASKSDANNTDYFGDGDYRYFKWERIKWRVLQNNGSTLFVVADRGLDCKNYNETNTSITWENCTLRTWLNGTFYNTAFSSSEQGAIMQQTIANDDNPLYGTEGGNDTQDNIYLLSLSEVTNPEYGFCELHSACSASRWIQASDYAHAMGGSIHRGSDYDTVDYTGNSWWLLRSSGYTLSYAADVDYNGYAYSDGYPVNHVWRSAVPALQINLNSDCWSLSDDESVLSAAKKAAIRELENYKSASDYREAQQKELSEAIAAWRQAIRAAADEAAVNKALSDAKAVIDQIKTDAQLKEDEKSNPANPVHHCTKEDDGSDYTDWSYVYFGSYPQTEVTGDGLTAEITGASYDSNGDAWVNGAKYRRISKSDANYDGNFGSSDYRYFKWKRIKWRVLQNNGSTLFVVADQGLDCKGYNETDGSITWENCTLRTWLNGTFYNTAFSSSEQDAIVQQTVVNDDNPQFGTEGGNDTQDNIYLLSIGEVTNPEYGFCVDYGVPSASRWMQTSDYAHAMGVFTYSSSGTGGNANCTWWLRSPGDDTIFATDADVYGHVSWHGSGAAHALVAVAPVLQINLNSDCWSMTDDGTGGEGGDGEHPNPDALAVVKEQSKNELESYKNASDYREAQQKELSEAIAAGKQAIEAAADEAAVNKALSDAKAVIDQIKTDAQLKEEESANPANPKNPVHNCTKENDGTDTTTWSYVYFGSYPQSEVTGDALTAEITGASYDSNGDAWVDGIKYRRASISDTFLPDNFGDGEYRYFKWERIKWRVLQNNGSTLFVMADQVLDCKDYNEKDTSITWENCTLRTWLNGTFYNTAFTSSEQGAIVQQMVVNDDNPLHGTEGGNDTQDNIYLLSFSEVTNPEYGFCELPDVSSVSRRLQASDYANVMGAYVDNNSGYEGNCMWRLRSPGWYERNVVEIHPDGSINSLGGLVCNLPDGCVPALQINLSSDLWSPADDEATLTAAKKIAASELENYKPASDYREAQQKELLEAIAAGKQAIEAAADEAAVNKALSDAKAAIDQIKTDAQLTQEEKVEPVKRLVAAKNAAVLELESYKSASDYREAQQKELSEAIAAGKRAIAAAADEAAVSRALSDAKAAIDRIKTNAQLTQEESGGNGNADVKYPVEISSIAKVTLSQKFYTYNGKQKKPGVTVKAGKITLKQNTDYIVAYNNNKSVGTASVIVTGVGNYTGTITKTFKIIPKGTSISKLTSKSKAMVVKWKKQKSATGYQVQYSTSARFTKATTKTKTVKKVSKKSLTIKKLKAKKKYYVRIRTYKTVNGKKYYSDWSIIRRMRTK